MKHHFLLNPAAGKGTFLEALRSKITETCSRRGVDFTIYTTTGVGDATVYVRRECENSSDTQRFYACGGDGTLSEIVNGLVGYEAAEFALIPVGTGNDFWRTYGAGDSFFDIERQLDGEAEKIDLIRCNDKYCINMMNIGFDCNSAITTAKIKRLRFIPSKLAYVAGVVVNLFRKIGTQMRITLEDGEVIDRPLLLTAIANGNFCGGGFKAAPIAKLDDSLLDLCIVEKISRLSFVSLVSYYKAGTHLENKKIKNLLTYRQSKSAIVEFNCTTNMCIDGEIWPANSLRLSVIPLAVKFSVPRGVQNRPPKM